MPSARVNSSVKRANQLDAKALSAMIVHRSELSAKFQLEVMAASGLLDDAKSSVWSVFEANMHDIYIRSSFGWDPQEKKLELFDPASRFILIWDHTVPERSQLIAYTTFRFDMEEGERVVYCYELQVVASARRQGLGQHLMSLLVTLGRATDMEKVMLTVQKSNAQAFHFYASIGFMLDPASPDFGESKSVGLAEEDWSILSRRLV